VSDGSAWAARVPVAEVAAAAALRLLGGVTACVVDGDLWLRGESSTDATEHALDRLAPAGRFAVLADGALIPSGRRLPDGHLPDGATWKPLAELIRPRVTSAALPASPPARVSLELVRSSGERPATVLVTPLVALADYADGAPAVRLERLQFAADATRAVIRGDPLPPLPGERFTERSGIAAPCGYAWRPAIDPTSLRRLLGLSDGDLALLAPDGTWQCVPAASFVRARRSAVRLTVRGRGKGTPE
jgi:hypothetical protein